MGSLMRKHLSKDLKEIRSETQVYSPLVLVSPVDTKIHGCPSPLCKVIELPSAVG